MSLFGLSKAPNTLVAILLCTFLITVCSGQSVKEVSDFLKEFTLQDAAWAMKQEPVTVTSAICERSKGGKHDFYSEGDYWWPDPDNPGGPYIQRDGMTNPQNFVAHRKAMVRFSRIIGSLASAYTIEPNEKYVRQAFRHLRAWFSDSSTMMNPSLLYAQAISGRVSGRGIGIIDTIHLIEVAQGIRTLEHSKVVDKGELAQIKIWFDHYIQWLMTHPYGQDEMNATNNHSTCWVMQVASFAALTGNDDALRFCRKRFREILLPQQMAADGSFPRELGRTKPYGYSLFNLDAMVMVCHILSDEAKGIDLWAYEADDGKNIKRGIEFMFPYVKDKDAWPYPKDVMYGEEWPVAHPFLLFGAVRYSIAEWFDTWKSLSHDPKVEEVLRNLPVRYPLIWLPRKNEN